MIATRAIEDAILRYDPFHRIEVNSRTWVQHLIKLCLCENMGEHGIQARPCEHFFVGYIMLHIVTYI